MYKHPFQVLSLSRADKDINILGPGNLRISVDYDDVDHDRVRAVVQKMVILLNQHWGDDV